VREFDRNHVRCAYSSEVQHVLWEVNRKVIQLEPKEFTLLVANFPVDEALCTKPGQTVNIFLKAIQVPLISNDSAALHKLQGSSLDNLYVPSWSYQTNWPYVLISRFEL